MKSHKHPIRNVFASLVLAILAMWFAPAEVEAQGRVTWETNFTFTAVNANDNTNSTVVVNANYTGGRHVIAAEVETDGGDLAWSLSSNISTGAVANIVSIPAGTTKTIYMGEGYSGPISFRYQTVETNLNNVQKIKLWGTN